MERGFTSPFYFKAFQSVPPSVGYSVLFFGIAVAVER